jgi:hypothetical protein
LEQAQEQRYRSNTATPTQHPAAREPRAAADSLAQGRAGATAAAAGQAWDLPGSSRWGTGTTGAGSGAGASCATCAVAKAAAQELEVQLVEERAALQVWSSFFPLTLNSLMEVAALHSLSRMRLGHLGAFFDLTVLMNVTCMLHGCPALAGSQGAREPSERGAGGAT